MRNSNDLEYDFTIEFPDLKNYPGDFVIRTLAEALTAKHSLALPISHTLAQRAHAEQVDSYKSYLSHRLLKAVQDGMLELWDGANEMVSPPPSGPIDQDCKKSPDARRKIPWQEIEQSLASKNFPALDGTPTLPEEEPISAYMAYEISLRTPRPRIQRRYKDPIWWAIMSTIQKSDLVNFCKAQRIKVVFEEQSIETSRIHDAVWPERIATRCGNIDACSHHPNTPTVTTEVINASIIQESVATRLDKEPITSGSDESNLSKQDHELSIPGKIPRTGIGKLVVELAWDIECKTGKSPNAKEIMRTLHALIDGSNKTEILMRKLTKGVEWRTDDEKDVAHSLEACGKVLSRWRKSRP